MPWLAAFYAFLLGPLGFLYVSMLLFIVGSFISLGLFVGSPGLAAHYSDWRFQLVIRAVFAAAAWFYASSPPDLTRFPLIARLDPPEWRKAIVIAIFTSGALYLISQTMITSVGWKGHSMIPTIRNSDRFQVVISRLFRGNLRHDSLVRFPNPGGRGSLVSRVVALEGDAVKMKKGLVYVNDKAADDPTRIARLRASGCIDERLTMNN